MWGSCRTIDEPICSTASATGRISLKREGLWDRLNDVAEAARSVPDEELDPINRSYYALRIPCPYLENEMCSIYEARPSACRELLVTSPAELCQDMVQNPVTPLPVSMRISFHPGTSLGNIDQLSAPTHPAPDGLRVGRAARRGIPTDLARLIPL